METLATILASCAKRRAHKAFVMVTVKASVGSLVE